MTTNKTSISIFVFVFAFAMIMTACKAEVVDHLLGYDGIPDSDYDSFGSGFAPEHRSIGDKVRFIYEGCPMLRVTREYFFNCDPTNPITRLVGNIFQFEEFGDFYFICESAIRCDEDGLRDHIRVGYYNPTATPSGAPAPGQAILGAPSAPAPSQSILGAPSAPAPSQAILGAPVPSPSSSQSMGSSAYWINFKQLLIAPLDNHLASAWWGGESRGAVSDMALDSIHLTTRVDAWEPLVDGVEVL